MACRGYFPFQHHIIIIMFDRVIIFLCRQQFLHDLLGRFRTKHLTGSLIQHVLHLLEFIAGHGVEISTLGEEVSDQPIGILVGPSFPRRVWVCKVHDHVGLGGEELVLSHLQTVVVGHGQPNVLW